MILPRCEIIIKGPQSLNEKYIVTEELLQKLIFVVYHDGKAAKDNIIHDIIKNIRSPPHTLTADRDRVLDKLKIDLQRMREGESKCDIHLHYTFWYDGYEKALDDIGLELLTPAPEQQS